MGRTNPTYRDWLRAFERDWGTYRRGLRRQHQDDFDRLFERAAAFADAAGYANRRDPELAFVVSVLLSQEAELQALRAELDDADVLPEESGPDESPSVAGASDPAAESDRARGE